MTKGDLIDAVAKSAKLSKRAAEDAVDATFEGISRAIKKSKRFQVPGFGTFHSTLTQSTQGKKSSELALSSTLEPVEL